MKKFLSLLVIFLLLSCDNKNVPDCFQNSGNIIQEEVVVSEFSKIIVFERVQLILKEAPKQKVIVETGEYLRNDIEVSVQDSQLVLRNNNGCNISRDYGITKIYVHAPNITEIRSSTGLPVLSDGILNYPDLNLVSEDFGAEGVYHTDGDFKLELNCQNLNVINNNLSHLFLSGTVENLFIGFYAGDSRFEGRNLKAQNISIFQRSSNDMILNPQVSVTGEIRSTGNVILVHEPPLVDVKTFYKGRLMIE
ncbi:DUF2807 domain-containing protein [Gelidibacter salicanalis]|uniref:DUF2807 domain-containing protein n=1 Tax=Gelidibacter salicanalis TaxID=291193 RepID=A0A5C7AE07_9FLAO|nr:head GIN domain-containing protein [Gelidibacter salicanalis]TXE06838.1 DUF2807 domain-containing protein [Gelidibacter salicanalis]